MARPPHASQGGAPGKDAMGGHILIEVRGVSGLRSVRVKLMELAYQLSQQPRSVDGLLVLVEVSVTPDRLREEWKHIAAVLRPDILGRLTICVAAGDHFIGIPRDLHPNTQAILAKHLSVAHPAGGLRPFRDSAFFVILKVLLHHLLTDGQPVTNIWLAQTAGYSYPTVANVLARMGSLIERQSDRRIRLRWFAQDQLARLLAVSDRVRGTARFSDRSAQPRSSESHVRRLEKLNPKNIAIGGVMGASHYFPDLDLVGSPRLDISQHWTDRQMDLGFIEKLDPALKLVDDPLEPATVVVHQVRHAESFFVPRESGLQWADSIECLMDLHEAHLDSQATQFIKFLERERPRAS